MNKEQIVEYLEKEIERLRHYTLKNNPSLVGKFMGFEFLLAKIKEEPKPVELEVGGYYCDLSDTEHKFKVLSLEVNRYFYMGYDVCGDFVLRDWYSTDSLTEGVRHLTPDEIKELDQRLIEH